MARRAAPTKDVFRFTAVLERMPGRFGWTFVEFPHDVQELFGKKGTVRVKGTVNGVPMDRALMPTKSGCHVIVLGIDLRRQAKVKAGDRAAFEVWRDPHPEVIELPEELRETLDFLPAFKADWEGITPGMKRSILVWLNSAKTASTRAKRIAEVLRRSETGHPWSRRTGKKSA